MLTIIETPLFSGLWPDYWTEDERTDFAAHLSANPDSGDVIREAVVAARFVGHAREVANAVEYA